MSRPRHEEESSDQAMTFDELAHIAKGLGHGARLGILEQFLAGEPHIAQEIVGECTLAQSTVSEHLRILREAGILVARKDGSRTWYCLRRSRLNAFIAAVEKLAAEPLEAVHLRPAGGGSGRH